MSVQSTSLIRCGVLLVLLTTITACATHRSQPATTPASHEIVTPSPLPKTATVVKPRPLHEKAAATALRQIGTPYRYGGADAGGFDCSGLVYFAYRHAGKQIPRTTGSMWNSLQRVPAAELRAGDVLFFRIEGKVSHVGMYLGDRRFVHAPQRGREVSVAKLDSPYYRQAYIGAGRP